MANTYYLLMLLLVLGSSASDGGLACSAAMTILCLYSAHPVGGFLTISDGVFFREGVEPGCSVFNNSSAQSEETHQQYDLPHLLQNLQYLPKNFLSCSDSLLSSTWGIAAAYMGSVKIWGGYLNPWPVGTSVSEVLSSACMDVILWGAFLFLVLMLLLPSAFSQAWYFSVLVWMSWTILNFPHVVFTFTSTSRASSGILQNRYWSRLQAAFRDLLYVILELKFASIRVVCDSNAGDLHMGVCYSHSHSRLNQDFLCFSIMYMCIRSFLPNNLLTFSLWMSGTRSVVG